jgi:hypothetical protein
MRASGMVVIRREIPRCARDDGVRQGSGGECEDRGGSGGAAEASSCYDGQR